MNMCQGKEKVLSSMKNRKRLIDNLLKIINLYVNVGSMTINSKGWSLIFSIGAMVCILLI